MLGVPLRRLVGDARAAGSSSCWRRPSCCGRRWPFFERGWASLVQPQPEHVHADRARRRRGLSSTASSPRWPPASSRLRSATMAARSAVYFEAAAVIVTLILLGQVLELRARERDRRRDPRAARPRAEDRAADRAGRLRADVPLDAGPGRRPPARPSRREGAGRRRRDGGGSSVDKSMVTGEPLPVEKAPATR